MTRPRGGTIGAKREPLEEVGRGPCHQLEAAGQGLGASIGACWTWLGARSCPWDERLVQRIVCQEVAVHRLLTELEARRAKRRAQAPDHPPFALNLRDRPMAKGERRGPSEVSA